MRSRIRARQCPSLRRHRGRSAPPRRPAADELDGLAEERLLLVLGVMPLAELAVGSEELAGADRQPARLDAAEDLRCEAAPHGIGLDEDEAALHGHRERRLASRANLR